VRRVGSPPRRQVLLQPLTNKTSRDSSKFLREQTTPLTWRSDHRSSMRVSATRIGATRMFHEACWRSNLPCFDKLTIVSKSSESAEPARSGRQINGAWLAAYQHETAQSPILLITISQYMRSLVLLYAYS